MPGRPRFYRRALGAAALAAVAGCSAGGSGSPTVSGAPSPAARASGSATGHELSRLLPGRAALPAGWSLTGGSGQETDSGPALAGPPYLPTLPRLSCARWKGVDPQFLLAGDEASYAQLSVTVGHGGGTALGGIGLAGYYPGWAAKQFALIESLAYHRCGPFTLRDEITGARVRMKPGVAAVPGLGDQALLIRILQVNGPLPDGSYYPGDYLLVARVGSYLADVAAPAFPGRTPARAVRTVLNQLVSALTRLGGKK
ncbi:MAG TPA: hypothetical protein VIP48_03150 [Streptosporangiaceae bacterium]